jgi:hypothetical protein
MYFLIMIYQTHIFFTGLLHGGLSLELILYVCMYHVRYVLLLEFLRL